jgi:anti-sigma factor RsiW
MMNCAAYHEDVSRYIDRELDEGRIALLFVHLGGCAGCRDFLSSIMELRSALHRLPAPSAPATLDRRIHAIRPGRQRLTPLLIDLVHGWWNRRLLIPVPALAGTALLLLSAALVSFSLWQSARHLAVPKLQVMYIMSLPTVDVEGFAPAQHPPIQ